MLNCIEATRLMSEALERPLTLAERLQLQMHVAMCRGCRQFGRQMPLLRRISREYMAAGTDDESPANSDELNKP